MNAHLEGHEHYANGGGYAPEGETAHNQMDVDDVDEDEVDEEEEREPEL